MRPLFVSTIILHRLDPHPRILPLVYLGTYELRPSWCSRRHLRPLCQIHAHQTSNEDVWQGCAAKLYEQHPFPSSGLPSSAVFRPTASGTKPTSTTASSAEGRMIPANDGNRTLPAKRGSGNMAPTVALAACAQNKPLTSALLASTQTIVVAAQPHHLRVVVENIGEYLPSRRRRCNSHSAVRIARTQKK